MRVEFVGGKKVHHPTVTDDAIKGFFDEFRFLSNFESAHYVLGEIGWRTSEHGYQADKTLIHEEKMLIANLSSPVEAKRAGQKVTKRGDWDIYKPLSMYHHVLAKFAQNREMAEKLLLTEKRYLEETNDWGDTYWGVVPERGGMNMLGKTLMLVRTQLPAIVLYSGAVTRGSMV